MGYFIAILRQRIASFEAPVLAEEVDEMDAGLFAGVSINDLRKNLDEINTFMEGECASAPARYGVEFDASLITGIDPPPQVESALAAINTAHNEVHADISLAKAQADQTIVQSKRAVEIETLKAQAEVEPLLSMAEQLQVLQESGPDALLAYLRNVRLELYEQAQHAIVEVENE
jgi:regulator of protease activity HflC (stomatin/prohibitin superfamily)